ncbi:MAG: hypothetical protein ACE5G0_13785 [Rhodothermales bacterium]
MKHLLRTTALVGLILLLLPSCGSTKGPSDAAVLPETTIRVRNNNWLQAKIYVVRDTLRVQLGTVSTGEEEIFVIPEHIVAGASSLRFAIDFIGRVDVEITEDFPVIPGDQLELVISNTQ